MWWIIHLIKSMDTSWLNKGREEDQGNRTKKLNEYILVCSSWEGKATRLM